MIKYVITPIHSRQDHSGNTYWAFNCLNTETGRAVDGSICGGESNIRGVMLYLASADEKPVNWEEARQCVSVLAAQEMAIRPFDRRFKPSVCEYAGCLSEEIARFIRSKI